MTSAAQLTAIALLRTISLFALVTQLDVRVSVCPDQVKLKRKAATCKIERRLHDASFTYKHFDVLAETP